MDQEQKSILTIALMAAFSDRHKADSEREAIKRVAESLSAGSSENIPALYQDVLLKRVNLDGAVESLKSPETKHLAYEMAVCVCDADGIQSEDEKTFLSGLRTKLGLAVSETKEVDQKAEALAMSPVSESSAAENIPAPGLADQGNKHDAMILNYAILNGALELLPDSL